MQLHGFHHLTAVSADARGNHDFYTRVLGMRLVKKTVNQDDVSAYHLFYADGVASPGTDITFFDFPTGRERRGTHSVVQTGLRVSGAAALAYWSERLEALGVARGRVQEADGRQELAFEDPEGQRLALVDDGSSGPAHPWSGSPVPAAHQISGLGPITMSVPELTPSDRFLTEVLAMRRMREYAAPDAQDVTVQVYAMGDAGENGGAGAELHVRVEPKLRAAQPGAGGVHHVAFRVRDEEYDYWVDRYRRLGIPSSGPVDRFYFRSLYAREPGGVLFEIATEGPGFATDEPLETLGQSLSLPPFLEARRASIERGLKPL